MVGLGPEPNPQDSRTLCSVAFISSSLALQASPLTPSQASSTADSVFRLGSVPCLF